MALLFMDGFDAGDYGLKWIPVSTNFTLTSSTRFGSGRSLRINWDYNTWLRKLIPASSKCTVGFAVRFDDANQGNLIDLSADGGSVTHIRVRVQPSNGTVMLLRGGTQIASSTTGLYTTGGWNYIELSGVVDSVTGQAIVRLNGEEVINFSGNTRNGGSSTDIDSVYLYSNWYDTYFDDLYIVDGTGPTPYNGFLGDVRVQALVPSGAGSSTQFTPSAGANYENVDELTYSMTDYVEQNMSGIRDLYTLTDLPATDHVYAVCNNLIAKKTEPGNGRMTPLIKSGSTTYTGATGALALGDTLLQDLRTQDPNTSNNWRASAVNALESGMEIA